MPLVARPADPGTYAVDSLAFSIGATAGEATALAQNGVGAVFGYLGAMNHERLAHVHDAGMAMMPVTFGGRLDGDAAAAQLHALGIPPGVHVWLDVEGPPIFAMGAGLIPRIAAWCTAVRNAGYVPAGYIGSPQPLTSEELWKLPFKLYWRGQGSIRDRYNALAEPDCGWCMTQSFPSFKKAGVLVDAEIVGQDYHRRAPVWCAREA